MSTSKNGTQFCCSTSTENLIDGTKLFKSYRVIINYNHINYNSNRAKWVSGEYLSQLDSQSRFNLTLNVEPIWLLMLSQFDSNILQLPTMQGRILIPQVT